MRKVIGRAAADLAAADTRDERERNTWYCNLFYIDGRKCLIFMHAATLICVVVPGVTAADMRSLSDTFRRAAREILAPAEGLSPVAVDRLVRPGPDQIASTASRSILGCMNEHIFTCRFHARLEDGYFQLGPIAMSRYLNRTPLKPIGYKNSRDLLLEFLKDIY